MKYTEGIWSVSNQPFHGGEIIAEDGRTIMVLEKSNHQSLANAEHIVKLHNQQEAVQELIEAARELLHSNGLANPEIDKDTYQRHQGTSWYFSVDNAMRLQSVLNKLEENGK